MKAEVNILKSQVQTLSKQKWIKGFLTRIYSWGNNNPTATRVLKATARHLLPDGIKENIPDDILDIVLSDQNLGSDHENKVLK